MPRHPSWGSNPRILICRLSAIGDVIHAMPVLTALRERFPKGFLAWAVENRGAVPLLEGHSSLDDLVVLPRGWYRSPRAVWQLRQRLRTLRIDLTLDVQGLTKSALVARLSGAPQRIGFGDEKGRELSRWLNNVRVVAPATHVIDANLMLLQPLGIAHPAVRFDVPEAAPARETAERVIGQLDLQSGFAVVNPGAGWPSKLWPAQRYAAVARYLGAMWNLPSLVVWAGEKELGWAGEIVSASGGHARLAPATSLAELAALARRARLFVGSDTGPLHLAVAVGTPCVGLYGPMPPDRNGPYGPQHIALQKAVFSGPRSRRRTAPPEIMGAIQVEHVTEACDTLLRRPRQQAA